MPSMKPLLENLQDQRWLGVVAVLMVLCTSAALGAIAIGSQMLGNEPDGPPATPTAGASTAPVAQATDTSPPPSPIAEATSSGLPDAIISEMVELEGQVSQLRGLARLKTVERRLIDPAEFGLIVEQEFLSEYGEEQAEIDRLLYSMLGLVSEDFDFYATYHSLYLEQVAGYYDDEQDRMMIVRQAGFEGPERLTYVHEFVHALQDQHFPFEGTLRYNSETCERDSERCVAVQALLEGDATLLEEQWLRTYASEDDLAELNAFFDSYHSPAFESAPGFIQDLFLFPYLHGREFVLWHYRDAGWAAIDEIYADPPASSEQILHPERYPEDDPVLLEIPDSVAEGLDPDWNILERGRFGEYELSLILAAYLDEQGASRAATGWGGSSYLLLQQGDEALLIFAGAWDTVRDAQEAWLALREYGSIRFGEREATDSYDLWRSDGTSMLLETASDQVLWILAPSETNAVQARGLLEFPVRIP